jgi:general transcription factor 3C polypeptide 3 (transcription factor C subunit 4)
LIGIAYLGPTANRNVENSHELVLKAFTFLFQYAALEEYSAESWYNVGRAFHQLGLFDLATHCYQYVLSLEHQLPPPVFLQETAYNQSLIYIQSGSRELAFSLMSTYLRIM